MARFRYSAASADGTVVNGVEAGAFPANIRDLLLERNLQPITIVPKRSLLQLEITKKKVKKRALMHLCRQLCVFLRAGISVLEALTVLLEETTDKVLKKALAAMRASLEGGTPFSEAAAEHPELFPTYAVEVLRSAELTGDLDDVLDQLADYLDREIDTKHKVNSALAYPVIVLGLALAVSVVLVVYVLPKFKTFFASLHAKLPLPTRMLLAVTRFLSHWGLDLGGVLVLLIVFALLGRKTQRGRALWDRAILKIPIVGKLIKTAILERFCRLLASMTVAGVPLPEALAVTTGATNNRVFRQGLTEARAAMMRGEGLAGPLAASGLFPGAARQMFRVGEDTGTIDEQLRAAADYLDRELDFRIKQFTTAIEPAVIIGVGAIVGFVAIALVSAMYGIFNQVKA